MATQSWSSKVETVPSSDPFPVFVWADTDGQAKRIANAALGGHYSMGQLRTRITLTADGRHRYAVRGPKATYNLKAELAKRANNRKAARDGE